MRAMATSPAAIASPPKSLRGFVPGQSRQQCALVACDIASLLASTYVKSPNEICEEYVKIM